MMVAHHPKASIYSHYLVGLGRDEMTPEIPDQSGYCLIFHQKEKGPWRIMTYN
jgi:hypothetical protein